MHIYLSKADWDEMITGETSIDGEVTRRQFNSIISRQLQLYILRSLNRAMTNDDATVGMLLPALKLMLISEEHKLRAPSQSIHVDGKQDPDYDHHQPSGQCLDGADRQKATIRVGRADGLEDKAVAARLAGLETEVHHIKEHLQRLAEQTDKSAQEIASKLDLLLQRDVELGTDAQHACSNLLHNYIRGHASAYKCKHEHTDLRDWRLLQMCVRSSSHFHNDKSDLRGLSCPRLYPLLPPPSYHTCHLAVRPVLSLFELIFTHVSRESLFEIKPASGASFVS